MPTTPKRSLTIVLFAILAIALGFATNACAATCNLAASPSGSDAAAGTSSAPFHTAQKLADALAPGQIGCLRAGVYSEDLTMRHGGTSASPIVIQSYPGERATIVGRVYLAREAQYVTLAQLNLVGLEHGHDCGATMCPSPAVNANHTTFLGDDVTNNHGPICFVLGDSHGVYGAADYTTIEDSRIHDCGAMPATNYDHGIYMEQSYGSRIINNLIYDNADRGIQLYPQAEHTLIQGNIIYGNGEGVDFGGSGPQASNDNVVQDNIIAGSKVLYNVMSAYGPGDVIGHGNIVRENCVGGGAYDNTNNPGGIRFNHDGFTLKANTLVTPQFIDPAHGNFTLRTASPCSGILAGSSSTPAHASGTTHGSTRLRPTTIKLAVLHLGHNRGLLISGHQHTVSPTASAATGSTPARSVLLKARVQRHWSTIGHSTMHTNGTFQIILKHLRIGNHPLHLMALVTGIGQSNIETVRRSNTQ